MQLPKIYAKPMRRLQELPLHSISKSPTQTRTLFDEYELSLLSDSIKQNGLLQPITVRKTESGYQLIAGERRLRAAALAGLKNIPAIVYDVSDESAAIYTLIENLQRADLSPFDEAEGIKKLITVYGLSQCDAAAKLSLAPSTLSNKLRLLRLSENQRIRIEAARLTERHARAVLRLPEERRDEALDIIIAGDMTVAEAERLAEEMLSPKKERKEPYRRVGLGDVRLFANSLQKIVDTMVKAGYTANTKKNETDSFIEYTVRIDKQSSQMKLI